MAMISSLWDTLLGKQKAVHKKEQHTVNRTKVAHQLKGNHNPAHLEKRKLVATRSQLESQSNQKLDLDQLRARIDRESDQYSQMRQRQQTSMSRWFGARLVGIDEAALTKRLASPVQRFSQDELELSLNFSDIHLPDYYEGAAICLGCDDSSVPSGFALDCPEDIDFSEGLRSLEDAEDISDTADFSDIAADFADIVLMPPLVSLSENVPELNDLLARLQIVEWLEAQ